MLGATALLLVLGLVMVLSASSVMAYADSGSSFSIVEKQLLWVAVGVPLMVAASRIPLSLWRRLAYPAMAVAVALLCLLLVPGVGRSVNGNTNWIDFGGPFRIQPSEAAKFALVLWGADLLARKQRLLDQWRHLLIPLLPVAFGVIALVLVGGDLGTALVLMAIVAVLLLVAGAPMRLFGLLGVGALGLIAVMSVTAPHRMRRFQYWLNPENDPLGAGWQALHGKYALASGGWWGLGLGASREKWGNLPEAHTDFIFAVVGEELGLLGTVTVLLLFAASRDRRAADRDAGPRPVHALRRRRRDRVDRLPGAGQHRRRAGHPADHRGAAPAAVVRRLRAAAARSRRSACCCPSPAPSRRPPPCWPGARPPAPAARRGAPGRPARRAPPAARSRRAPRRPHRAARNARPGAPHQAVMNGAGAAEAPCGARVVLAGGGTAGHVEPALALGEALLRRDPTVEVAFLGTPRGLEARLVPARGHTLELISAVPIPRRPGGDLVAAPARVRRAVAETAAVLDRRRAEVVVGFGGYVAGPAYLAARRRKIPVVVHEANARPGLANRLGARFAAAVVTAGPEVGAAGRRAARASRCGPRSHGLTGWLRARRRWPTSGWNRAGRPCWSSVARRAHGA